MGKETASISPFIKSRPVLLVLCVLFIALSLSGHYEPRPFGRRVNQTSYSGTDGLNNEVVVKMVEDKYGFMWLLNTNSLEWFNGRTFREITREVFNSWLQVNEYYDIAESPDLEIWISHDRGLSVYQPDTYTFRQFAEKGAVVTGKNKFVGFTATETVVFNGRELSFIDRKTGELARKDLFNGKIYPIENSVSGFYFLEDSGIYYMNVINPKEKKFLESPADKPTHFFALSDSEYIYQSNNMFTLVNHLTTKVHKIPFPPFIGREPPGEPVSITVTPDNLLLMAFSNEVHLLDRNTWIYQNKLINSEGVPLISNGHLKSTYIDRKGNLWLFTDIQGLIALNYSSTTLKQYSTFNSHADYCMRVLVDKETNQIFSGTYANGVFIYDSSQHLIRQLTENDLGVSSPIVGIGKIAPHEFLISTFNTNFFLRYNSASQSIQKVYPTDEISRSQGLINGYFSKFLPLPGNRLLYNNGSDSLFEIRLINNEIYFKTASQESWAALLQTGQVLLHAPEFYPSWQQNFFSGFTSDKTFEGFELNSFVKWGDNWAFGTQLGIIVTDRFGRELYHIDQESGLPNNHVNAILLDDAHNLWVSHNRGITRITPELNLLNLNKADGLQGEEFNLIAAYESEDGEMFFGGSSGLNSFRPEDIRNFIDSPAIRLTYVGPANNPAPKDTAYWNMKQFTFASNTNQLQVEFSGIGKFGSSYYNYQYRIKEHGPQWINLNNSQVISLSLSPGNYNIEIAGNQSFNPALDSAPAFSLIIEPPFYLRWWGILGMILIVVAATWLLMFLLGRQKQIRKKIQQQHEENLERERNRISRDLHDNIGAYASALLSNVEKLQQQTGQNPHLSQMKENAHHILASLRDTIWVLGTREMDMVTLQQNFNNFSSKLLRNYEHISYNSVDQIEVNHALPTFVAMDILKILQEGMQNIILHSEATEVDVKFSSTDSIEILLSDNGKGFTTLHNGKGYGLGNMEWRARRSDLDLKINGHLKEGCAICIKLDLPVNGRK